MARSLPKTSSQWLTLRRVSMDGPCRAVASRSCHQRELVESRPDKVLLFVPDLLNEVRQALPEIELNGGRWVVLDPMPREIAPAVRRLTRCADLGDSKLTTVLGPADPALTISCAHDRRWRRPRDCEVWIVVSYGHIAVRSVKLIDPVNDIR